ncbi:jg25395 [Pararge aegeria aegeria]|uniref:Jg25395 protein n=1 Tax=Pararge aegeria aegeria TaxID=348720 RepID=A0A8S4RYQ5_9NEOP|nr:jg25395 [Pararge aegeria aegeria]
MLSKACEVHQSLLGQYGGPVSSNTFSLWEETRALQWVIVLYDDDDVHYIDTLLLSWRESKLEGPSRSLRCESETKMQSASYASAVYQQRRDADPYGVTRSSSGYQSSHGHDDEIKNIENHKY